MNNDNSERSFSLLNTMISVSISLSVFHLFIIGSVWCQDDDTVDLVQGTLRGSSRFIDNRRIHYFLGVPYAEPPLNNRRFRPSSPHNGWTVNISLKSKTRVPINHFDQYKYFIYHFNGTANTKL